MAKPKKKGPIISNRKKKQLAEIRAKKENQKQERTLRNAITANLAPTLPITFSTAEEDARTSIAVMLEDAQLINALTTTAALTRTDLPDDVQAALVEKMDAGQNTVPIASWKKVGFPKVLELLDSVSADISTIVNLERQRDNFQSNDNNSEALKATNLKDTNAHIQKVSEQILDTVIESFTTHHLNHTEYQPAEFRARQQDMVPFLVALHKALSGGNRERVIEAIKHYLSDEKTNQADLDLLNKIQQSVKHDALMTYINNVSVSYGYSYAGAINGASVGLKEVIALINACTDVLLKYKQEPGTFQEKEQLSKRALDIEQRAYNTLKPALNTLHTIQDGILDQVPCDDAYIPPSKAIINNTTRALHTLVSNKIINSAPFKKAQKLLKEESTKWPKSSGEYSDAERAEPENWLIRADYILDIANKTLIHQTYTSLTKKLTSPQQAQKQGKVSNDDVIKAYNATLQFANRVGIIASMMEHCVMDADQDAEISHSQLKQTVRRALSETGGALLDCQNSVMEFTRHMKRSDGSQIEPYERAAIQLVDLTHEAEVLCNAMEDRQKQRIR